MWKQGPPGNEGRSPGDVGEGNYSTGNSNCKCPEAGAGRECLRNRKETLWLEGSEWEEE